MSELRKDKLNVTCRDSVIPGRTFIPRRYTLTHSDVTGDLFLTIDCEYDDDQISGLYTRFMRDEVLAEWIENEKRYELHIYVHVSGGFVFGWAKLRYKIFKFHMPSVLKAIRNGDIELFELYPNLDQSQNYIHFISKKNKYNKIEEFGMLKDYK